MSMFDVPLDFLLPDLSRHLPRGGRLERDQEEIELFRYDTDHGDLASAGWSVSKESVADREVVWTLRPDDEPPGPPASSMTGTEEELTRLTMGLRRGRPLRPIGRLRLRRTRTRLLDRHDQILSVVTDETRHGSAASTGGAELTEGRQIDLTGSGGRHRRIAGQLTAAGGRPARPDRDNNAPGHSGKQPAAGQLLSYLQEQDRRLRTGDLALRRGDDAVHSTRVAARRLRSVLRTFASFVDSAAAGHLQTELAWYAGVLGSVRDAQVQRERFARALLEVPDDLQLGPVAGQIDQFLLREQIQGQHQLDQALDGDRYRELLQECGRWAAGEPELLPGRVTSNGLITAVHRAGNQVAKRLDRAGTADDPAIALHRARKAAKRARYAAELARPALGNKRSKRLVRQFKGLQNELGDHQDSVLATELLRRLGASVGVEGGHNGFTYGLLFERERASAARIRKRVLHRS